MQTRFVSYGHHAVPREGEAIMRTLMSSIFGLALCLSSGARAQIDSTLVTVAVLDLTSDNVPAPDLRLLSDRLRVELFKTGKYAMIERERMESILQEHNFQMSACAGTECAVNVGQLLGARKMVAGGVGRIGSIYTINARIIDVETGKLERVAARDCSCPVEQLLMTVLREVAAELAGIAPLPGQAVITMPQGTTPSAPTPSAPTPSAPVPIILPPAPSSAGALSPGSRQTSSLSSGGRESYRLSVPREMTVVISADKTEGSQVDPKVTLVNDAGAEIGSDDDSGEGTNALLTRRVPPGNYTLVVSAYGSTSGSYLLSIGEVAAQAAQSIQVGDARSGSLGSSREESLYTLYVPAAQFVAIAVDKSSGSSLDPTLAVRSDSGAEIARDDDSGEGTNSLLYRVLRHGTYQLAVTAYGSTSGSYTVSVTPATNLGSLDVGARRNGSIRSTHQVDLYALPVPQSSDMTIRMEKVGSSSIDSKLFLFTEDGQDVASDDDGGGNLNAQISQTIPAGRYLLAAVGYNGTTGDYAISTGSGGVISDNSKVAMSGTRNLRVGDSRSGSFSSSSSEDVYTLQVAQGQFLAIAVDKSGGSSLDPTLALRSESGGEIARDDDGGEGTNSLLCHYVRSGTYRLAVTAYGSTSGGYTISITPATNVGFLDAGSQRSGSIRSSHQLDLYVLSVPGSGNVVIRMDKVGTSSIDPKLILLTEDGQDVATDDDGGGGLNAQISQSLSGGRYLLIALGYGGSMGDYVLSSQGGDGSRKR